MNTLIFKWVHCNSLSKTVNMSKKRKDDEDWTAGQSYSKKNQPSPQSCLENCILHGCKGTVNAKFIPLSSKADPLSAFTAIHGVKKKLQTQMFDYSGMKDVCESIPDGLSSDCGYHEDCRHVFPQC